tara:strand:+ start:1109 stop:2464 length:1356 start_codon:yes stop_codon:yes gene_type:complete
MKKSSLAFLFLTIFFLTMFIWIIPFVEVTFGLLLCMSSYFIFGLILQLKEKNNFNWFKVLSIKLILTILIAIIFVQFPLLEGDTLRTSFQDTRLQDSNYYDYIALELVNIGLNKDTFHLLFSTWSSFGIISYIYTVYTIFGTNYLVIVIVNSALSVLGISFIYKILILNTNNSNLKSISYGILLPLFVYYDATPSKETLTFLFIVASLFYNYRLKYSKKYLGLIFSLLGLFIIRPNVALLLLGFFLISKNKILSFNTFISGLILTFPVYYLVDKIIGVQTIIDSYFSIDTLLELKSKANNLVIQSPLKLKIIELFDGTTFTKLVLFIPFRLIIWLVLPFPLLYLNFYELFENFITIEFNWLSFYHNSYSILRSFNVILLMYFIYNISTKLLKNGLSYLSPEQKYIFNCIIYLGVVISTFSFANSSRYRILIEPLVFALFISMKYLKNNKIN